MNQFWILHQKQAKYLGETLKLFVSIICCDDRNWVSLSRSRLRLSSRNRIFLGSPILYYLNYIHKVDCVEDVHLRVDYRWWIGRSLTIPIIQILYKKSFREVASPADIIKMMSIKVKNMFIFANIRVWVDLIINY